MHVCHTFFINSTVGEHLDCLCFLSLVNNAMGEQVAPEQNDLISLGKPSSSGIATHHGISVFSF